MNLSSSTPFRRAVLSLLVTIVCTGGSAAQESADKPFLHPLFTDNMVLQREVKAPIWGWAPPGTKVTVTVAGRSVRATTDPQGKWMTRLGPLSAGGPFTVEVVGVKKVVLTNVVAGDVWICSGQSNMEMGIGNVERAQEEIAQAIHPMIRLYTVPKTIAFQAQALTSGKWEECTPQTVSRGGWGGFTAVGYFFGRHLNRDLNVPIGLIHTSWGGTIAEAWTSAQALERMSDFRAAVAQVEHMASTSLDAAAFARLTKEWYAKNDAGSSTDGAWAATGLDTANWKTMDLPQNWEKAGLPDFDGVVWFRRSVRLPVDWIGKDLMLHLGPVDDYDTTWVNGTKVGGVDDWSTPRDYRIPAALAKSDRIEIAVRVLDTGGDGGIYGRPDQMKLELAGGGTPVSLAGQWHYQEGVSLKKATPFPQNTKDNPNIVTVLYNGMIAPLLPYGIKGAIWYQGESNAGRGGQYRTLLPALIQDWRARFGVGDFPFLVVQLANFMPQKTEPAESPWAEVREAQLLTSMHTPKVGLAVAIDIGDAADIHPKNKQEVGRRLGLAAKAIAYQQKIEYSGPIYRSMETLDARIRLKFDHLGGGLVARGGALKGFAIAGEDKHFVWGEATIDGDSVIVSSPSVSKPVAVRYAWAENPDCNLYNQAGLPASPFRTDSELK